MPRRRFFLILLPWLAVIGLTAVASLHLTRITTDITELLPQGEAPEERLLLAQLQEGPAARLMLLGLSGSDVAQLARISRHLRSALAEDPAFSRIENGALSLEQGSLESLYPLRYLLGPDAECRDDLHGEGLGRALETRLRELSGPLPPPDKHRLGADPTACFRALLQAWRPAIEPRRAQGVWFTSDGSMALLVVQTRAAASGLEAQEVALSRIRDAFRGAAQDSGAGLQIAGPGAFAVGSRDLIRAQTTRLSLFGTFLVVLILTAAFRNPWLTLLGALPLASGMLAGILVTQGLFGHIQGIALAMGLTLLGVALDYPLHVISHARFGAQQALRSIWSTLFLGAWTTALGYLALTLTDFAGLVQLGVLAATGALVAVLTSRYLLPPLLDAIPRREQASKHRSRTPSGARIPGRLVPILGGLLCALLLIGLAGRGLPWETDLRRLSTVPPADIALDRQLRSELGVPDVSRLFYRWADDPEQALQSQEQVRPALEAMIAEGRIQGYEAASLFLPSERTQRLRQAQLPDSDGLARDLERALQDLPFRREAFAPFLADVAAAKAATPATMGSLADTAAGAKVTSVLLPVERRWLSLVPLIGLDEAPESIPAPPPGMHYIDLTAASSALLDRFLAETISKLELSAAAIFLVLLIGLRNLGRLGRVVLVIGLTLQLDLILIVLLDGQINLFHLVGLLLVVGLSIDYGLFFTRPEQPLEARSTTFTAVALSAFSSFAMFALLGLSSIPVLHAIGSTVAIGIGLAFVLSWMLRDPGREQASVTGLRPA